MKKETKKRKKTASAREQTYINDALRIERTSRSLIVHVKMPLTMGRREMEEVLDDEADNAMEIIMKEKEVKNV